MWRYIVKRLLAMIPVLLGVAIFVFTLLYLTPGDPATLVLGETSSEETRDAWRQKYDLDKPFVEQFYIYIRNIVLEGNFGNSYRTGRSVTAEIANRFPTTFTLAVLTASLSTVLGISLGIFSAKHRDTWIDNLARIFGMIGVSMPIFWFAILLIMLFSVRLKWLPISGIDTPLSWVLPTLSLALTYTASLMRMTRSSYLDCVGQDYVRTAKGKGQSERVITRHHVLRNALIPIVTSIGGLFGVALGGAMIMEQIYSIPGLGSLMITAINNRDYPQIRASVLMLAVLHCTVNLLVDLLYAYIDPRIKSQYQSTAKRKPKKVKVKEEVAA